MFYTNHTTDPEKRLYFLTRIEYFNKFTNSKSNQKVEFVTLIQHFYMTYIICLLKAKTMKRIFLLLSIITFTFSVKAQRFVDIHAKLYGLMNSSVAWFDYDDDGDLDILLTGENYKNNLNHKILTKIYRNNRNDKFTDIHSKIINVCQGSVACGDFDIDGDLDIFLSGKSYNNKVVSKIYKNGWKNTFKNIYSNFTGLKKSSVSLGDFDNDGDLDILLTGEDSKGRLFSKVYRNERNSYFTDIDAQLIRVSQGAVSWGDFDNDGDLDVLLTGEGYNNNIVSRIYRNDSNNIFTDINAKILAVKNSSVDWGDYDNDGDLDILLTGESYNNLIVSKVYRNDGYNIFTDIQADLVGVKNGSSNWGDYDNDGDLDILITGKTANNDIISKVYRNDGDDQFTDINAGLKGVCFSSSQWGDYDNDGDLDILLSGLSENCFLISKVYRNDLKHIKKKISYAQNNYTKPNNSVFKTRVRIPLRKKRKYYFVYSSCYCNPDNNNEKSLNLYISNVLYTNKDYSLQNKFDKQITNNDKIWSLINQGYRILGFVYKKEALTSRMNTIKEYHSKGFKINYLTL